MSAHADIVVVGGGPVGCAFALALAGTPLRVNVLEASPAGAPVSDARILALSYASKQILERIGAWPATLQTNPIACVHVTQRGSFGRTMLEAADLGLPALGYVVRYAALADALRQALRSSGIGFEYGASVDDARSTASYACVEFRAARTQHTVTAQLVVLADGGRGGNLSRGVSASETDYRQTAVVGLIKTDRHHAHIAHERFTPDGPAALLPIDDRFAFVWTVARERADEILGLPDHAFLLRFQSHFGEKAGRFLEVGPRNSFPLRLRRVRQVVDGRVVRVGNAAQTLHPVAAQGFNLGLRDAWELARRLKADPVGLAGEAPLLHEYARARRLDTGLSVGITDLLVRSFGGESKVMGSARGIALQALDSLPPLKRLFARKMIFGASG